MKARTLLLAVIFAIAACANNSELTQLTNAKEDFNTAVQRVVNYELGPRCSDTVTTNCAPQAIVDVLVEDVNSCASIIDKGGNSTAVRNCTATLTDHLAKSNVP